MRRRRQKPPSRKYRSHRPGIGNDEKSKNERRIFGEVLREELAKALAPAIPKVVGQ
jgi:hypothetical protein